MSKADDCVIRALHTGISVYNMDESIAWYEKNLGFKLVRDNGFIPQMKVRIAFVEKGGHEIELFEYQNPKKMPEDRLLPDTDFETVGTKHLALLIKDYDGLREYYQENDVEIVHETIMKGNRVMFIHDCNGVLIELICQHENDGTDRG